jgi:hypothetical protein
MDQVWVLPDGRVQLLDFDLDGQYGFAADDAGALALLRQVAVLTVEGERRPPGAPPASIRAPVPRHAVELLDRLLGVRSPFGSLAEFRAALGELREQPTETTRELRTAHVGVQGFFLALGVAWMLVISGLFGWFDLKYTRMAIEWDKKALTALDDPVIGGGGLKPVIHSYNADGQLRDRLQRQLQDDNAYLARRLQSVNAAERMIYNLSAEADSPATDEGADAPTVYEISEATFKLAATRATAQDARTQGWWSVRGNAQRLGDAFSPVVNFVLLAIVPAIWVLWAFVTRGGLALPLMGLALVRADGRKAARWQCAWRAFLVWLPVVVPLWACVQVKVAAPELRYVHSGLWWLAVAVLLGEVILAVLRPWRALHDRLAGTYVVPL